eukprot:scaffold24970_cov142-Skeletonema_dohrnii-CCMP3373.AAC.3
MKSFQAVIIAAIAVSAAAINEPVASPTAAIERELAEYERQLGTDVTGAPTDIPPRPTGVSLQQPMRPMESRRGCYAAMGGRCRFVHCGVSRPPGWQHDTSCAQPMAASFIRPLMVRPAIACST